MAPGDLGVTRAVRAQWRNDGEWSSVLFGSPPARPACVRFCVHARFDSSNAVATPIPKALAPPTTRFDPWKGSVIRSTKKVPLAKHGWSNFSAAARSTSAPRAS